jgi:hypothetical protein
MSESRLEDGRRTVPSPRRGGVHAMADVIEELMDHYAARFSGVSQVIVVVPEEEAVAA